jgi:predicted Zn-dependent protease
MNAIQEYIMKQPGTGSRSVRRLERLLCRTLLFVFPLVLSASPAQTDLRSDLARVQLLEDQGNLDGAADLLVKALREYPANRATINFNLGTLALRRHDWLAAIRFFQESRQDAPRSVKTLFYLGQAYYQNGETALAVATLDRAVDLAPSDASILQKRGEYICGGGAVCPRGLEDLLRARNLDPNLDHIDYDLGVAEYKNHQFDAAKLSLQTETGRHPGNAAAHFYLGEICAQNNEWQEAQQHYEQSIQSDDTRAAYYLGLGHALMALDKPDAALLNLLRALELDFSNVGLHFELAQAYKRLGRSEDARHEIGLVEAAKGRQLAAESRESLSRDPSSVVIPPRYAKAEEAWKSLELLLNAGNDQAALAFLTNLNQKLKRENNQNWFRLGAAYYRFGKLSRAVPALQRGIAQHPSDPDIHAWLGRTFLQQHQIQSAQAELDRAIQLEPENQIALVGLGELSFSEQRWRDAIQYFENSRSQQPEILVELCYAYSRIGERDQARLISELLRILAPHNPEEQAAADHIVNSNQ